MKRREEGENACAGEGGHMRGKEEGDKCLCWRGWTHEGKGRRGGEGK